MHQCIKLFYFGMILIDTLVHLVGFTTEIYYDARPYERHM